MTSLNQTARVTTSGRETVRNAMGGLETLCVNCTMLESVYVQSTAGPLNENSRQSDAERGGEREWPACRTDQRRCILCTGPQAHDQWLQQQNTRSVTHKASTVPLLVTRTVKTATSPSTAIPWLMPCDELAGK